MLEQVELKIQELQKKQAEEYYKKKDEDLRSWGLTTKKDGKKTVPIIVTDDEYEALIKASNGVGRTGRNSVSVLLNAMSVAVLVIGIVTGFVLREFADELGLVYLTAAVVVGAVFAALLKGAAEAVRLLQQIIDGKPMEAPKEVKAQPQPAKPQQPVAAPTYQPARPQEQPVMYYQQVPVQPPVYHQNYSQPYAQPYQQPINQQPTYQPQSSQETFPPQSASAPFGGENE